MLCVVLCLLMSVTLSLSAYSPTHWQLLTASDSIDTDIVSLTSTLNHNSSTSNYPESPFLTSDGSDEMRRCFSSVYSLRCQIVTCWLDWSIKKTQNFFHHNLKKNYPILIIFGTRIHDKTGHQVAIQFPTSPNICFCTTWGKQNKQNITFLFSEISLCDENNAHLAHLFLNF